MLRRPIETTAFISQEPPGKNPSGRSPRLTDYLHMKRDNPLSMPESERSLLFSAVLKRIGRFAWVLVVNTFVAWAMFTRLRSGGFPPLDFQLCFEFAFEVVLPITGIALELVNWKYAKWVNVGCFAAAGCFWLVAAVWDHSDPFFGVLLITALGLLLIAGLSELAYRITRSDSSEANS